MAVCRGVNLNDEQLGKVSELRPGNFVVRLRYPPDPCLLALTVTYVEEDYSAGYARLRNPSLQALLYLTLTRQAAHAIEASRGGDVIAVGSATREGLSELLRTLGASPAEPIPLLSCDKDSLHRLSAHRLDLIR